jgi:hypothetical protein
MGSGISANWRSIRNTGGNSEKLNGSLDHPRISAALHRNVTRENNHRKAYLCAQIIKAQ